MALVFRFDCPHCGKRHSISMDEGFHEYGNKLHSCKGGCRGEFIIALSAATTTKTYKIELTPSGEVNLQPHEK